MGRKKKIEKTEVKDQPPVLNILDINSEFSKPVEPKTEPVPPIADEFRDLSSAIPSEESEPGKRKYRPRKPKEPESDLPIIDGEMLLLLIDILFPMIISTTHNIVSDTRVSPDDLTLTDKQKMMMKTFADKVAERIRLNANPFLMLFAGLGGIYTMNYLRERDKLKKP